MNETKKKILGEFLACTFIGFFGLGLIVPLHMGYINLFELAVCFGLVFALTIIIFSPISGCHLTPGVTITSAIFAGFNKKLVLPYSLAQIIGWGMGTVPLYFIFWNDMSSASLTGQNPATWFPSSMHNPDPLTGILLEIALSVFLVITIFGMLDHSTHGKPKGAGLAVLIGAVIGIGVCVGGGFTGPCINTARDLGPRIVALFYGLISGNDITGLFCDWQWVMYFFAPIIGCLIGGFVYFKIYKKLIAKNEIITESKNEEKIENSVDTEA